MPDKVLFVDDDQKILNGFRRQFDDELEFETANSPELGLELIDSEGPFSVVVSDMRMPGMNGIELLSCIKERSPDTVRIMLTGYADLQVTMEAVNEGNIFRFLSKPCDQSVLDKAIRDGFTQYQLVTAERDLLEGTLHGSIKVLCEVLSLVNPLAFGRTSSVQRIALAIAEQMGITDLWNLKIATMLFPLGCVTVSQASLECALNGQPIPDKDKDAFLNHATVAGEMLKQIPRLEGVASIVAHQNACFDGSEEISIGARILKAASDFELIYKRSGDALRAIEKLELRAAEFDPDVLASLKEAIRGGLCQSSRREVVISDVTSGMVLAADVRSKSGQLFVASGQEVTPSILRRLQDLCENNAIPTSFTIEVSRIESSDLATF